MPALYLGHGAPPLLDDAVWTAQLAAWAQDSAAAEGDPGRLRALGVGPADARRHRDRCPAHVRLLGFPAALLPG